MEGGFWHTTKQKKTEQHAKKKKKNKTHELLYQLACVAVVLFGSLEVFCTSPKIVRKLEKTQRTQIIASMDT